MKLKYFLLPLGTIFCSFLNINSLRTDCGSENEVGCLNRTLTNHDPIESRKEPKVANILQILKKGQYPQVIALSSVVRQEYQTLFQYIPKESKFPVKHIRTERALEATVIKSSNNITLKGTCHMRPSDDGDVCAIFLKPNGDVDSIHPKQFVEEYKRAGQKEKQELAELAKNNMDKIVKTGFNVEDQMQMENLIQLEDVKSHVTAVHVVAHLHEVKKSTSNADFAESVKAMLKTLSEIRSKAKVSHFKLSQALSKIAIADKESSRGAGTESTSLGRNFLAKSVINGIINNDTTAFAIVGTRVGYEGESSNTHFKEASVIGEATKYLGEAASPIGATTDINLGAWFLTKSQERINDPPTSTKYDKNDAIADLISDAVSTFITSTVEVLSSSFPEAAPVIMAIGIVVDVLTKLAVALFKVANNVKRINAEVPLSKAEKKYVFSSRSTDWFGTRGKDYIDYLVEEKAANDLLVQHNLRFLLENPSFRGIVFPSRTLQYEGSCSLTVQHCALKNAWGCSRWEQKFTAGTGCDWNRPCSKNGDLCNNYWEKRGKWGYDNFECKCQGSSQTNFNLPRKNSYVDFRSKKKLYWERAVPKDVEGADFMCKPGSTSFQDYKLHQENSRVDYLCQNAIALLQPPSKRNDMQTLLINLDDGWDTVFINENDKFPILFRMGDEGHKQFFGGGGRAEFLFDGNCTRYMNGTLTGGRSERDAVSLLSSCAKGYNIYLDFYNGKLTSANQIIYMELKNIEEVIGRENEPDFVTVDCQPRVVSLRGGKNRVSRDVVTIPSYPNPRNMCGRYPNVTILTGDYTNIESKASRGNISILADKHWESVSINLDVYPETKSSLIFVSTASHQVSVQPVQSQRQNISSVIIKKAEAGEGMNVNLDFKFHPKPYDSQVIYFNENLTGSETSYSALLLAPNLSPVFYHPLPEAKYRNPLRIGNHRMENIFQIVGPNWSVTGGERNDVFILHSPFVSMLSGGEGEDTISFDSSLNKLIEINLNNISQFRSIENVFGVPGNPVIVYAACDTKLVNTGGGSTSLRDTVIVPNLTCNGQQLQIVSRGHSAVKIDTDVIATDENSITVIVASSERENLTNQLQFELETTSNSVSGLSVAIQLDSKNWKSFPTTRSRDGKSVIIKLKGANEDHLHFILRDVEDNMTTEPFLTSPYIQITQADADLLVSGQLILERETLTPKILYRLTNDSIERDVPNPVQGFLGTSNMFLVSSGSWQLVGGNLNDIFTISSSAQIDRIFVTGGNSRGNSLILESSLQSKNERVIEINLETQEMGYLGGAWKGTVKNIQHVLGLQNAADIIHASCDTKSINGREGAGDDDQDLILVSGIDCGEDHQTKTTIYAGKYTKVRNSAPHGQFNYHVPNAVTTLLDLKALASNQHLINFEFNPWNHVKEIRFDTYSRTLGIKFTEGDTEMVQKLQMHKVNETSEDFTNPIIQFHQPGTGVTSDLSVDKNGFVTATFVIHKRGLQQNETVIGLPITTNRFMLNITQEIENTSGGSLYGSSSSETRHNQFWIFELRSTLDILDGGDCDDDDNKRSCTNQLQLTSFFNTERPLDIILDNENGSIWSTDTMLIKKLKNIHELRGRPFDYYAYDKLTLTSCKIRQISEMEKIIIDFSQRCSFNVLVEMGKETQVLFRNSGSQDFDPNVASNWMNSTFHYRFKAPQSIDLNYTTNMARIGHSHNYYLPFNIDDLELLLFDMDSEKINYSINGSHFHIAMIVGPNYNEQFYTQPVMMTEDGFLIQVARDGSILLSLGAGSKFPLEGIRSQIIPAFEQIAKKLGLTILIQTDTQFLYIGHDGKIKGDRNVLQNFRYSESHLVGSGAKNTIYDIIELSKDTFIYTGFENEEPFDRDIEATRQTLDLTDIIVPIRMDLGTKYVPKIKQHNNDLVILMDGHGLEKKYPGKIWIVNGGLKQVADRIQILLNNAIMDLVPRSKIQSTTDKVWKRQVREDPLQKSTPKEQMEWEIRPRPILIPEGTVYSISREDLENEHEIRVTQNGTQSKFTFQLTKNGPNLYFTNMKGSHDDDEELPEVTTVIINDYLQNLKKDERNDTARDLPHHVVEVTVNFPGQVLLLNDSKLIRINKNQEATEDDVPDNGESDVINPFHIQKWKHLLHEVEEKIFENITDISRTFENGLDEIDSDENIDGEDDVVETEVNNNNDDDISHTESSNKVWLYVGIGSGLIICFVILTLFGAYYYYFSRTRI